MSFAIAYFVSMQVSKITTQIGHLSPQELQNIAWAKTVFCTKNFWQTLQGTTNLCNYLRPVNAMLVWCTKEQHVLLLLSEREAGHNLGLLWQWKRQQKHAHIVPTFVNLCYARRACDMDESVSMAISSLKNPCKNMMPITMASLQLFNGEATFGQNCRRKDRAEQRKKALQKLLENNQAKATAANML